MYNALAYSFAGNGRQKVGMATKKGGSTEPLEHPLRTGLMLMIIILCYHSSTHKQQSYNLT